MENKILFRASGNGALMTNGRGSGITEKQLTTLKDYIGRIKAGGSLSETQRKVFAELKAKRDKPFELSDTAKGFIDDTWLLNERGYYKELKNPYVKKGIFGEEDGITLITEVDGIFYKKNDQRITKGHLTGECDIVHTIDGKKIIQDIKCSWDPKTFKNASMDKLYEWQGRTYMHLYDADEFWLRFCLIDCPPHLVLKQQEWKWREFYSDEMTDEEQQMLSEKVQPLLDQIKTNLVYSDNPAYSKEERVKTIKITRDDELFKQLLDRIPSALKYYNSIKLNMI